MQQDKEKFLNLKSPPARLTTEETAWFLGFSPHEIPVLMAGGCLKPLGHPPRNGPKFFATAELEDRRRDAKWLAKASDAIVAHWQNKNSRKSSAQDGSRASSSEDSVPVMA
jgi:hypothetical protein